MPIRTPATARAASSRAFSSPTGPSRARLLRWRGESSGPRGRRGLLATSLTGVAFLVVGGLLIWVCLWLWPPSPACLAVIGAGYETNLAIPHNVYGRESMKEIEALTRLTPETFLWRSKRLRLLHEPRILHARGSWDQGLQLCPEKTVILYLALHGGSDARGAYLLADDADSRDDPPEARDSHKRLRLTSVLDTLGKVPKSKNKVLILDATQVVAHWPLGLLRNDFARELEQLNRRIVEIPNLVVLSASGIDEQSWVSEDWRQTIFAHSLIEGLKGGASNAHGRIDLLGLYQFVRKDVESWASANRRSRQTPVLLPLGPEGEARAGRIELVVTRKHYKAPDPSKIAEYAEPVGLRNAWETYERLGAQIPPPSAYAPHFWSRYQATLLRFEALERAGDRGSAKVVRGQLGELERRLAEARHLTLRCSQNSLGMPAVEGRRSRPPSESLQLRFNELWSASPDEYGKLWEQMQVGPGAPAKADLGLLRLQLLDFLRNSALEGSADVLKKAALLARVLDDSSHVRPAEIHDLVMLQRDLVATPPLELRALIARSIEVRRLAEAAALAIEGDGHPYPEQVAPWIRGHVTAGDAERRLGHDLLFASDGPSWRQAGEHLGRAETAYRQALDDAAVVRSALRFRDEALPVLPYYARWIASPSTISAIAQDEPKASALEEMEELWKELHSLVSDLERPDLRTLHPTPTPLDPHPDDLKRKCERVRLSFETWQRRLLRSGVRLVKKGETIADWLQIDALLHVPFVLPQEDQVDSRPLRLALLDKQRELSRKFLRGVDPARAEPAPPPSAKIQDEATDEARRQGRMALAVLGSTWFDSLRMPHRQGTPADDFPDAFGPLRDRIMKSATGDPSRPLVLAGERIAHRERELAVRIAANLARLNRAARQGEKFDVVQALDALREADRLARLLDGPGAVQLEQETKQLPSSFSVRDSVAAYRKLVVQALLIEQARRAYDDHWYAEAGDAPPYYQVSGQAYLEDVEKLDVLGLRRREIESWKRRLKQPDGLRVVLAGPRPLGDVLAGKADLVVTSELRIDAAFALRRDADAPSRNGFPVFWLDPDKPDDPLRRLDPVGEDRLVRRVGDETEPRIPMRWASRLSPDAGPAVRRANLALHGRFRGQILDGTTKVDLYPEAESIASHHPLPDDGGIAVRASDEVFRRFGASNGAVAVVLDCSGSMGPPQRESFGPETKYKQATDALETLLREMPAGTLVSLWTFGSSAPEHAEVEAEETIKQVLAPTPWSPAQLESVMASVRYPRLEPWNFSPIVRTMWRARSDLTDAAGFKTLLVITDGADDRFDQDRQLNRDGIGIPAFLRETFADSGISVNVINVTGTLTAVEDSIRARRLAEATKARGQFEVIQDFPVPGRFYAVEDALQLAARLKDALKQSLTYRILADQYEPIPGISSRQVSIARKGANDQWFPGILSPGGYQIQLTSDRRKAQSFELNNGDLLLVTLVEAPGGIGFERSLYSEEYFPNNVKNTLLDGKGEWRLSVLQNQRLEGAGLQMLVTLEKRFNRRETTLAQVRPREIWMEVAPESKGPAPFSLRWANRENYPAPAWSVAVKNWPASGGSSLPARPVVRAWWNPGLDSLRAYPLERGKHFRVDASDDEAKTVQADGGNVVVESVRIETHRVRTDSSHEQEKTCLVVRLTHPPGQPCWVRPNGIDVAGYEHRFYTIPGKYTGVFWTKTEDEAKENVTSLDLISLDRFKAACEAEQHKIELLPGPPRPDSVLPPEFGVSR